MTALLYAGAACTAAGLALIGYWTVQETRFKRYERAFWDSRPAVPSGRAGRHRARATRPDARIACPDMLVPPDAVLRTEPLRAGTLPLPRANFRD